MAKIALNEILVCPDSFKGSLTSEEATEAISQGLRKARFEGEIIKCPLSDGGEGFLDIVEKHRETNMVKANSCDVFLREIETEYLIDPVSSSAYIESAKAIGIELIKDSKRNPLKASSLGLGLMIKDALKKGVREIFISLGGSASSEAGMGMLSALGIKFFNKEGELLYGTGDQMAQIATLDTHEFDPRLKDIKFHAVCDVENPLLGDYGAVKIFSPQKGATAPDINLLEKGMENFCSVLEGAGITTIEDRNLKGGGAAGGLGYTLQALLGADFLSGTEFVEKLVNFQDKVKHADLVITGEGCVDRQSLMGKVLSGILKATKSFNVALIAFGGKVKDKDYLINQGLDDVTEISLPSLSLQKNMEKDTAFKNLENAVCDYFQ